MWIDSGLELSMMVDGESEKETDVHPIGDTPQLKPLLSHDRVIGLRGVTWRITQTWNRKMYIAFGKV